MNKAFNILLIAAVLVGLFSAFLVVRLLKSYQQSPTAAAPTAAPQVETKTIAFAKVDIEAGTLLDKSLADMKAMPINLVPEGVYENLDEPGGVVAKHFIPAGDILLQSKFENPEQLIRASMVIPMGMRTITLTTDEIRGNALMVKAGDIVDIIFSADLLDEDGNNTGQTVSRIFLQAVKVFDVVRGESGPERTGTEPEGAAAARRGVGTNVTFLVDPQQAEILHNASKNAELTLLLRRYNDLEIVQTTGVIDDTLLDLVGTSDLLGDEKAPPPPPPSAPVEAAPARRFY